MTAPIRRRVLETIAELQLVLGRAPDRAEVATAMGRTEQHHRRYLEKVIHRARRDGGLMSEHPLRVSAAAKLEMGMPVLVYLAWPVPQLPAAVAEWDAAVRAGIEMANELVAYHPSVVPVSPYLTAASYPDLAAPLVASRCDGVVVMRDPLLLARADVHCARRAGIPIGVVISWSRHAQAQAINPWTRPHLVDADPAVNRR